MEKCPMNEVCFIENASYNAKISCNDLKYKQKLCKRIWKTTFRKRYANH